VSSDGDPPLGIRRRRRKWAAAFAIATGALLLLLWPRLVPRIAIVPSAFDIRTLRFHGYGLEGTIEDLRGAYERGDERVRTAVLKAYEFLYAGDDGPSMSTFVPRESEEHFQNALARARSDTFLGNAVILVPLVEIALTDPSSRVRMAGLQCLGSMGPDALLARTCIVRCLADADPACRIAANRALYDMERRVDLHAISESLSSESVEVRRSGWQLVVNAELGRSLSAEQLELGHRDSDDFVRSLAGEARHAR
jgi:hypothetical protein